MDESMAVFLTFFPTGPLLSQTTRLSVTFFHNWQHYIHFSPRHLAFSFYAGGYANQRLPGALQNEVYC